MRGGSARRRGRPRVRPDGPEHGEVSVERGAAVWGRLLLDRTGPAAFSDATVALAALSLHAAAARRCGTRWPAG